MQQLKGLALGIFVDLDITIYLYMAQGARPGIFVDLDIIIYPYMSQGFAPRIFIYLDIVSKGLPPESLSTSTSPQRARPPNLPRHDHQPQSSLMNTNQEGWGCTGEPVHPSCLLLMREGVKMLQLTSATTTSTLGARSLDEGFRMKPLIKVHHLRHTYKHVIWS
jgi:hypothetical protein